MERPKNQRALGKKYAREIFSRLPLKIQLTLSEVSRWLPQLEKLKNGAWRPLIVGVLACHMAACQPTRGFEDQTPPSPTPIVEPYHPQPTPELIPTSPLELTPTPESTPIATPGPTISGETLTISDSQLELKDFDGEEIAQLINASEKGWQVITNNAGKISFFSGYAGEAGKESQVVILAQGPKGYQWNPDKKIWENGKQVVIPDILLPGGWNEEKQMAGPAYEADIVFLFKDNGNYRIGVVYNPEKVAQISDKSNLEILPDGSGLFVGSPKNIELQEGQKLIRDEDGNLRLTNPDGSYLLMRTSWSQVTSPNQLYQAGTFAGPFETQPTLPYPTDEIVQELGITNYQVVDNHYIALQEVVDQQTGETHQYIIAQAITNKEGKFRGWQRTLPFDVESGLVVPHPQETNPELFDLKKSDAPIPRFVNAMRMGGIEIDSQEVANNLQYQIITGADGKQYVIGTFNLDPDPNKKGETLEGPIPLVMWSEEGGWRNYDINTGFVLAGKELFIPAESGWGNRELRQGVEQGWQYFPNRAITNTGEETTYHPSDPFQLNAEKLVFASKFIRTTPGRIIAGHLVWGYNGIPGRPNILPDYLVKASNEEKLTIALRHVEMVMSYFYSQFPNRNFDWVVCAEATSGNIFKPLGLHLENPDNSYVILSYRQANEVLSQFGRTRGDRGDRLAYSDFITSLNDSHISEFISILQALKSEGLIDLFHLQIRYGPNLDPNNPLTASQLSTLIDRIANEAGVPTIITELGFKDGPQSAVTKGFAEATKACLMTQNCKGIMFDKVLPENERENELFSFVNRNALPDQDYYAVLQSTLTSH